MPSMKLRTYAIVATIYFVAISALTVFDGYLSTRGLLSITVPSLFIFLGMLLIGVSVLGFNRRWYLKPLLRQPEWGLAVDLFAAVLIFLIILTAMLFRQLRSSPELLDLLLIAPAMMLGAFSVRRSLLLIKYNFLINARARLFTNRPAALFVNDVGSIVGRLSTLPLILLLAAYSGSPGWLSGSSFLLGWLVHSLSSRHWRKTDAIGRNIVRLDPMSTHTSHHRRPHQSPQFEEAKHSILDGKISSVDDIPDSGLSEKESLILHSMIFNSNHEYERTISLLTDPATKHIGEASGRLTYHLNTALYQYGKFAEVIEVVDRFSEKAGHKNSYVELFNGLAHLELGQPEKALQIEEEAERRSIKRSTDLPCPIAIAFQGLIKARMATYGQADDRDLMLSASSDLIRALTVVSEMDKSGELKSSQRDALKSMLQDILSYTWYKQGLTAMSQDLLEKCIQRSPTYPWPYFHLALHFYRRGLEGDAVSLADAETIFRRISRMDRSLKPLKNAAQRMLEKIESKRKHAPNAVAA